jgi:hypothetical protein
MKAYWGSGDSSTHSLPSALDGGERSASRLATLSPGEKARGTDWIGGWVGPRAGLNAVVRKEIVVSQRCTTSLSRLLIEY